MCLWRTVKLELQPPGCGGTGDSYCGYADRPTMNSVARRILGNDDIVDFPEEAIERGVFDFWDKPVLLPPEFEYLFRPPMEPCGPGVAPAVSTTADVASIAAPASKRQALCVGIDDYPLSPLNGCVADADEWGATLGELGFQVSYLKNAEATRGAILAELRTLIET